MVVTFGNHFFAEFSPIEAAIFNPHFPSIVDIQCGEKAILL